MVLGNRWWNDQLILNLDIQERERCVAIPIVMFTVSVLILYRSCIRYKMYSVYLLTGTLYCSEHFSIFFLFPNKLNEETPVIIPIGSIYIYIFLKCVSNLFPTVSTVYCQVIESNAVD